MTRRVLRIVAVGTTIWLGVQIAAVIATIWFAVEVAVPALLFAWLLWVAVRFFLLPRAAWPHYLPALWARLRWRWLTHNLGLTYRDRHMRGRVGLPIGTAVKAKARPDNSIGPVTLRHPRARIRPDEFGLVATVKTVPGVARKDFEQQAEHIANAWRCHRVQVSQPVPRTLIVRGLRHDPLTVPLPLSEVPQDGSLSRLYLGRDEWGTDRWADLPRLGGIAVGGLTSYGKSTMIGSWLMQLAASDAAQFVIIDGKGAADYSDWADRAWLFTGDDLPGAAAALEDAHALMRERFGRGCRNMWRTGPTPDDPLIVTVIDECHTYFDLDAVKGDRQAEAQVRTCRAMAGQLVRKGRAALMLTITLTQKQTSDAVPTAIRDNCGLGVCFAVRTKEAAVATLGETIREYPSYCPTSLQDPAYVAVCTASLRTGQDPFVRLRVPEVSEHQAAVRARSTAGLRRDPRHAATSTATRATAPEPVSR